MTKKKIAFYLHDGIEILDFAGPLEVFTVAGFKVFTVGISREPITSQGVLTILPEYTIYDCPQPDIIAVFGGNSEVASLDERITSWLQEQSNKVELFYSVCTGAFFLAKAGLLAGKQATTFHNEIERLQKEAPNTEVLENVKYVDNGNVITAAGVSSGIDGALYIVEKLNGATKAKSVAEYIEYDFWKPNEQ